MRFDRFQSDFIIQRWAMNHQSENLRTRSAIKLKQFDSNVDCIGFWGVRTRKFQRYDPGQNPFFLLTEPLLRSFVNLLQEALEYFTPKGDRVTRTTMQSWDRHRVWLQHSAVHRPALASRQGPCGLRARAPRLVGSVESGRRRTVFMVMSVRWMESSHRRRGLFRNRVDQGAEPFISLLFVFEVEGFDLDFVEDLFDAGLTLRVFATIVFLCYNGHCQCHSIVWGTVGIQGVEKYDGKAEESTHVEDPPLSRVRLLQRGIYAPTAFVVQNVGANLSNFVRSAEAV
jgi:hypothetical protein